jgi:hypothetical protein
MAAQGQGEPVKQPPPGLVSADFLLFLERWYAATAKGGYGYQRKQEPGR